MKHERVGMLEDYSRYLLSIRDSLIQCGVGVPITELNTYYDVFKLGYELEELVWFYSVLEVCNSEYKLEDFLLPIGSTFRSKIHDMVYEEYFEYSEEYSKLSKKAYLKRNGIKDDEEIIDFFSVEESTSQDDEGTTEESEYKNVLDADYDNQGKGTDGDCSSELKPNTVNINGGSPKEISDNKGIDGSDELNEDGISSWDSVWDLNEFVTGSATSDDVISNTSKNIANRVASDNDVCYNSSVKNLGKEVDNSSLGIETVECGIYLEDYVGTKDTIKVGSELDSVVKTKSGIILEDYVPTINKGTSLTGNGSSEDFDESDDEELFGSWGSDEDNFEDSGNESDYESDDEDLFGHWGSGDYDESEDELDDEDLFGHWGSDSDESGDSGSEQDGDEDELEDDLFGHWGSEDESDGDYDKYEDESEDESDDEDLFGNWGSDESKEDGGFKKSTGYSSVDDELNDWGTISESNIKKVSFTSSSKEVTKPMPRNQKLVEELDIQIKDAESIIDATSNIFKSSRRSINKVADKIVNSMESDE